VRKGPFIALDVRKGPFITPNVRKGPFITSNVTKGSFGAKPLRGGQSCSSSTWRFQSFFVACQRSSSWPVRQ
jgi:hypothetical protein